MTDPRAITTQQSTGSGVQSLPRVLSLGPDGTLRITPVEELQSLRRNHRVQKEVNIPADSEVAIEGVSADTLELAVEIDVTGAREIGLAVRCSPNRQEATEIRYRADSRQLVLDMARSTLRKDVVYTQGPLDTGGIQRAEDYPSPRMTVEAPLALHPGETLRLRVFLDKPMLEVFANDRQCVTQQIFPSRKDSLGVRISARGGATTVRTLEAWDMPPARFVNRKRGG